jgi:plastocyanin
MISRPYALIFLAVLSACGGGAAGTTTGPPPGPPPMTATVNATPNIAFDPSPANIVPGGTITFAFGSVAHNVYFDAVAGAPADIPGNNATTSVSRTFASPGRYGYGCHIHPGMRGSIVVGATTTSGPTTGGGYYP